MYAIGNMNGVNEYGRVVDVELAKRIIIQWLYTFDNTQDKIDEVQSSLFEFDGGFFTNKSINDTISFGGPYGDSGLCIYTLNSYYDYCKEYPSINGTERDINSERIVIIDNNGSPEVFVIHEYD